MKKGKRVPPYNTRSNSLLSLLLKLCGWCDPCWEDAQPEEDETAEHSEGGHINLP